MKNKRVLEWITSHKIIFALLMVILYMAVVVIIPYIWIAKLNNTLEMIYYISQIMAGLFVVLGAALALVQYTDECNNRKNERKHQEDERNDRKKMEAAKLAKSFAEEAIPMINELLVIYGYSPNISKELIWGLYNKELTRFDNNEIAENVPKYRDYQAILAVNYLKNTTKKEMDINSDEFKNEVLKTINNISDRCLAIANKFEYYSICFNADIVDNDTLYQSLHDCFIKTVHLIYIFAFENNKNEYDRLYFNTSELYKRWKNTYNEKKALENQIIQEANKEYNINLANRKKDVTVSPKNY